MKKSMDSICRPNTEKLAEFVEKQENANEVLSIYISLLMQKGSIPREDAKEFASS